MSIFENNIHYFATEERAETWLCEQLDKHNIYYTRQATTTNNFYRYDILIHTIAGSVAIEIKNWSSMGGGKLSKLLLQLEKYDNNNPELQKGTWITTCDQSTLLSDVNAKFRGRIGTINEFLHSRGYFVLMINENRCLLRCIRGDIELWNHYRTS